MSNLDDHLAASKRTIADHGAPRRPLKARRAISAVHRRVRRCVPLSERLLEGWRTYQTSLSHNTQISATAKNIWR